MQNLMPGTVIGVRIGPFTHCGVFTGMGTVVTSSLGLGGVAEITLADFLMGRRPDSLAYLGDLDPGTVVSRARSMIGRPYRLLEFNCEHLARWAHGIKPSSPQVVVALCALAAVGLLLALKG